MVKGNKERRQELSKIRREEKKAEKGTKTTAQKERST
jgi:hypothetical protein